MIRVLTWVCLGVALQGVLPTPASAAECEELSSPAAQWLCIDILADGSATGTQDNAALAAALVPQEHIGTAIAEVPRGLCPAKPTGGILGVDLTALLDHLAREDVNVPQDAVSLSGLTVVGAFNAPPRFPYSLTISGSVFCGNMGLRNSVFGGNLFLTSNLVLAGSGETREGLILAQGLHVANDLELQFSRFGGLIASGIRVGGTVGVTEAVFGHASFADGEMQVLALARSRQSSDIYNRTRSWIDEKYDLSSNEPIEGYPNVFFANNVELWRAVIASELYGDALRVDGAISALGLEVDLLRFHSASLPAADFRDLIARNVEVKASNLGAASNRDTCSIDVAFRYVTDFVSFAGANIGESIEVNSIEVAKVRHPSIATGRLCLNNMRVTDTVDVSGLSATILDLSETHAGVKLALASDIHGDTTFPNTNQILDLTGFATPRLTVSQTTKLPSDTRLSAVSVGSLDFHDAGDQTSRLVTRIGFLVDSIGIDDQKSVALRVFAETLRSNGLVTEASALEFERAKTQTDALGWSARRVLREIAERLGGYGLMPNRTLWVALVAVLFGAVVARLSLEGRYFLYRQIVPRLRQVSLAQRRDKIRRKWKRELIAWIWFDAVVFSFDRLIPLVTINDAHKKLRFRHQAWVRAYFVIHALLGLLLAATVITVIGNSIGLRAP
ncbi:hypothetical protein ACERZ8_03420 [Tateyamaria armeniaca]|uniref:Uncharacterized protein n=1 Tax=Tateyamaria armeniaca TaxID=2518930 RepID=A0ABW8UUU2_9RHOB